MRFLLLLIIALWTFALLRRAVAWVLRGAGSAPEPRAGGASAGGVNEPSASGIEASRRLVRDPVCGGHVAEYRAIPLREGGELIHFCSTECRDQYVGSQKKLAANG
jgi:YHS domain-containing protein